jgi:hypothetical protein
MNKKVNLKKRCFLTLFILFSTSCDYVDNRLQIRNNSPFPIAFEVCKDTILGKADVNNIEYYFSNYLNPGQEIKKSKIGSTKSWSYYIKNSTNQKLNIYFFNVDILKKYNSMDTIISLKLYHKYEFTEQELEKAKWKIEYP